MTRPQSEKPCVRGCEWPESTPDNRRYRPARHGHICNKCYYGLERAIAELPAQRDELADMLRGIRGGSSVGYVDTSQSHPLPIDTRVADHRERIRDVLTSWARMVAEERQEIGALSPHPTVTATYLGSRLEWCAEQDWIDDLCEEMAGLRGRAFGLLYPSGIKRLRLGYACPLTDVDDDGLAVVCDAPLVAVVPDEDEGMPLEVECGNGHTWMAVQWRSLGRKLGRVLPAEYDRQAEALALGLSTRQVRRLRAAGTVEQRFLDSA